MFAKLTLRLRSLLRARAVDEELDAEVRFHVEQQTEELVKQGMTRGEAEAAARRQFGNVTLHKEECRDTRKWGWLEGLAQDLRQGLRTLRRTPGFTVVSVLTLAFGIGATSAMYSVVDQALLHPITVPDEHGLIWLQEFSKDHAESSSNPPRLADWQTARSFSAVAGMYFDGEVWASPAGPTRLSAVCFFGDLRGVLRPELQMGRDFTAAEERGEGAPVALLTGRAFREKFGSNAAILNQAIRLSGHVYQVIGVLSAKLDYPEDADLWIPAWVQRPTRRAGFLSVVGRLAPGASVRQAQAEVDVICGRLGRQYPDTDGGRSARISRLSDYVSEAGRHSLLLLAGAVGGVFLIGCLNIAGLLLARGLARRREAAIRVSVGAGYGRLARLFFAESLLLSLAGCAAGLLLAVAGIGVLKAALPPYVAHLDAMTINLKVVGCGVLLSLLGTLLFGGLPAWQFARSGQTVALKDGGAGASSKSRLRSGLIVAEVALSVVLLTAAALLANSFLKVLNRPLGFNTAHAYSFGVNLPWDVNPRLIESLAAETIARMDILPGTIACGVVDRLPLQGGAQTTALVVRGKTLDPLLVEKEFGFRTASNGYFAAAGIPVMAGQVYRDWQGGKGVQETVISQRLAEALFPGEDPIGHEVAERPRTNGAAKEPEWYRIVGVVGAVPREADVTEPAAEMYVPWGATYWPTLSFVVRTERPISEISRYVHERVQTLSTDQIFSPVTTLEERNAETRAVPRTATLLVGSFAVVALALSALGVFGLMAHETNRRTQEIGVRLALGARPESIAWDAVWRSVKLVVMGMVVGLSGAWYASELVKSLLFETAPHDLSSYLIAGGVLLVAGVLAGMGPALRAARIDPIQALRHE